MKRNKWKLIKYTKGYYLWKIKIDNRDVFNVTTDGFPPANDAGYYNLESLKKLKGLN